MEREIDSRWDWVLGVRWNVGTLGLVYGFTVLRWEGFTVLRWDAVPIGWWNGLTLRGC